MAKPIGGFFELEIPDGKNAIHSEAIALATGRSCIGHVIDTEKPTRVYVPDYSCYAVYQPMIERGVELCYYAINHKFEPIDLPEPSENELLLFVNFFGLLNKEAALLAGKYGRNVLIDDTHRFFHTGYTGSYSFTSARKYFGVPDGAFVYTPDRVSDHDYQPNTSVSLDHSSLRMCGEQEKAFIRFQTYEASLNCSVLGISKIGKRLLSNIDYTKVAEIRRSNFLKLHSLFQSLNQLPIDVESLDTPFCYPLLPESEIDKRPLYRMNIFVPTYWPDVLDRTNSGSIAIDLTKRLLPLPIDHRYTSNDMERLASAVMNLLRK